MTTSFIRVGNGKPQILGTDDRWGIPCIELDTTRYGWIEKQTWAAINCFQTPLSIYPYELVELREVFKKPDMQAGTTPDYNKLTDEVLRQIGNTHFGKRLQRVMRLNPDVSTWWQFNAYEKPSLDAERIRFIAVLGTDAHPTTRFIVPWSFADVVRHEAQKRYVELYNRTVARVMHKMEGTE